MSDAKGNGQGMIVIQADEHVPQDVVTGLNARGIEAYSAYHEDLSGASDREVFENNAFYIPRNP